ncbi:integral membrane protein [Colletotrichum kahawae]|uniref:Integral membrane protein n=1 Tax=Colletotrichum kahawae TaxID=34407 RepID=A0AAD9YGY0_COLKA|nr:integral membrane protein [Colletotrichum kahawae]
MSTAARLRGTLAPLPENHRSGLIILTAFSFLSFLSTLVLWLFITYKLLKERLTQKKKPDDATPNVVIGGVPDLTLGLDAPASGAQGFARLQELDRLAAEEEQRNAEAERRRNEEAVPARNPFPILVYNLLIADMMEALAYGLSFYWVYTDGIFAPSSVCWAQGWLGSTSNLAASLFLSLISVNTFLTVGLGYKVPPWAVYTAIAVLWTFDFVINGAGVGITAQTTPPGESFFMRANVWCWISTAYDPWRLWAHYFWVIVSIVLTVFLYSFVFFTLWRQKRSCRHLPEKRNNQETGQRQLSGYHPAFLLYPFVYVGCSVPLVVGRITSLLGIDLGIPYFAFAGCVLAANGLFNCVLWTTTILFSAPQDVHDTGLDRYAFMRTPIREYGHRVIIRGPVSRRVPISELQPTESGGKKEWWWWRHGGLRPWGKSYINAHEMPVVRSVRSYEVPSPPYDLPVIVEGPYIQLDVVTAVRVEAAHPAENTK